MKAYDSIRRDVLYNIVIEFGIPMKLVRIITMCLTETYNIVRQGKNLSGMFPIINGLKRGDVLSPLLFNCALEYAIKKVKVNQDGLKLNGTHQLLVYTDDVNVVGGSVHTIKENAEALIMASNEIGLEVNADKSKYVVMSRDQNATQKHSRSFERVADFIYVGTTLTNENSFHEEIKNRLKSGNASYHSVQNLLSSSLLSKNVKIQIYITIILPVVLYGCETWSLTLREERRLRVFDKRVLRRLFGPSRHEVTLEWRKLHNEELNVLYCSPNIFRVIKSRRMRWAWHVAHMGERKGAYRILVGKLEVKRPLKRHRRRWEDNINLDLREVACKDVDWIELAQDRDRWPALVNTVMNLRFP